jgi:signal transduction histidine kinase
MSAADRSSAGRVATLHDSASIALAGCALAGVALVATGATIAVSGADQNPALVALARALMVGAPIGIGLYAWHRRRSERFGLLLVLAGGAWFVTTLAESDDELLYTLGRLAGWLVGVLLVYLILSFPTGRLPTGTDGLLVAAMGAVVATMYLPGLVLAEGFEVPSPYTSCLRDCPANAFFVLEREPAFVASVMRPAGVFFVLVVMVAVVGRVWHRARHATSLTRRMHLPVLVVSTASAGLLGVALVARQIDPTALTVEVAAWSLALAVPAIAIAFLVGLLRWRLYAEHALQHLAECLRGLPNAATLRRAFAEAFGDPTIEIAFPASGSDADWIDSRGQPIDLPAPGSGRSVSEVRERGSVVAAIVHDEGLDARPELVDAGVGMAGVVLENQRLIGEAEASVRELRLSRARIATSAERERRRIERDLHDGAQQRLVALRIELELAEDLVRRDPERGADRLAELELELEEALEELRSLAHGVYPPLLADRGLAEALRAAAARCTIPVDFEAPDVGRYRPEIEGAVYFCVLEAMQNVLKHAKGARHIVIRLDAGTPRELRFSVRDNGDGVPDGALRPGAGITNMTDRAGALGGELRVTSTAGVGTVVRGRMPTSPQP